MILQSPLRTAIKTQMPDWVGYVFKKIDIFANEEKVLKIKNYPVFIIHGTTDSVVPYSHGKHLYDQLKKNSNNKQCVQMYSVDGCGHNDIEYRRGREFKKKLKKFIDLNIKKIEKKKKSKNKYNNNHYKKKNKKNYNYNDEYNDSMDDYNQLNINYSINTNDNNKNTESKQDE